MIADLSIVIPTHNRAALVPEAIESVLRLRQHGVAPEVIVVNDGSTDETSSKLSAFESSIRVIDTAHGERSRARNAGLTAATAPLVGFLDDDDLCRPAGWVRLIQELNRRPELDFAFGRAVFTDLSGNVLPYQPQPQSLRVEELSFSLLKIGCHICMGAAIVRRERLLELGGFDEALNAWEDWDLWLRLARAGKAEYVEVPCATVREPGWGSSPSNHHWPVKLRVRGRHSLDEADFAFLEERIPARELGAFLEQLACDAYTHGEFALSRRAFQRLLEVTPLAAAKPKRAVQLLAATLAASWTRVGQPC